MISGTVSSLNEPFGSWEEAAKWFESLLETFHESDQATISDAMADRLLHSHLRTMQSRLNATVNQHVRKNREQSVNEICNDVIQSVLDMDSSTRITFKEGEGRRRGQLP